VETEAEPAVAGVPSAGRRLRFWLEDSFAAVFYTAGRALPRRVSVALGERLGAVQFHLDRKRRRRTLEHLRAAYAGERSEREIHRIAAACFRHFGRAGAEALLFPSLGLAEAQRYVHYQGLEHVRGAYERGKGVLLVSGHYGNWELIAHMQGWLGLRLALVTRPLDNPWLERRLARLRSLSGNVVIHREGAIKAMLQHLRRGIGVAIVIDQDAKEAGVFVPFFGRLASTTPTPALLALRTGAAIVPVFSVPRADGSYDVVYEPALRIEDTGDRERDVARITAELTARLEVWVRRHPQVWSWMHRRWRTRPASLDPGA
jgi:KDO2-lipid IV(A) lauroyltransferase